VERLLRELEEQNDIVMRPFFTLRSPQQQAVLWRQSRSTDEILHRIDQMHNDGMHYLAKVLEDVGPQYGRHVTNAAPGYSWHQWGEAVDCFVLRHGKAVWDADDYGYKEYRSRAIDLGLYAGPSWDMVHVQMRRGPILQHFSPVQIDRHMEDRWA
jgi:hypothetical protein